MCLEHGIGKGKRLTSYPSFKDVLSKDYIYTQVYSGKCFYTYILNNFFIIYFLYFFRNKMVRGIVHNFKC